MDALNFNDLKEISSLVNDKNINLPLNTANDHIVRVGIMTEPFYWHYHPNSDEIFLGVEGILIIDFEDSSIELGPGQLCTVPQNILHRTRPKGARSVNLTFELKDMQTISKMPPGREA